MQTNICSMTGDLCGILFAYAGEVYDEIQVPDRKELKNGKLREQKVPAVVEQTLPDGTVYPEKRSQTDAVGDQDPAKNHSAQTAMIAG